MPKRDTRRARLASTVIAEDRNPPAQDPGWRLPYPIVVLLIFILMALRRPDAVTNPQFWSEDSNVFFREQLLYGMPDALFTAFAGYQHWVPRLVAAFASLFPIVDAPSIYNYTALILAAAALALFTLPSFAGLVFSNPLRLAIVLIAAAALPAMEILGSLTNIQWYIAPGALLLLCMAEFRAKPLTLPAAIAQGLLCFIAACTAPQLSIALPLIAWLLWKAPNWQRRIPPAMVLLGICLQLVTLINNRDVPVDQGGRNTFPEAMVITMVAPVYRNIAQNLLGRERAVRLAELQPALVTISGCVAMFAGLALLYAKSDARKRIGVAILAFVAFASISLPALARPFQRNFQLSAAWGEWDADRYVFLSSACFVVLFAMAFERIFRARGPWIAAGGLVALYSYGLLVNFRIRPLSDLNWHGQAKILEQWRAQQAAFIPALPFVMPFQPYPAWQMTLPVRTKQGSPASPWEGCLLRARLPGHIAPQVYFIENGKRRAVHTAVWITAHGFRWPDDVWLIPPGELAAIPLGDPLQP